MTVDVIRCEGLVKIYQLDELEVVALQGLELRVRRGEVVAIVGASGSGKSTLLNILAGLDTATAGRATVDTIDVGRLDGRARTAYRRTTIGSVWQRTCQNLLPELSLADNVTLPMALAGTPRAARRERTRELLHLVGVADRARAFPRETTGAEQQRTAIAVALANRPPVLLADEPTGGLGREDAEQVIGLFDAVNRSLGTTILVLTHDELVSGGVERTVRIRDGRTATETLRRTGGDDEVLAEELAVLDGSGRLQLPPEYVDSLELDQLVRLELEPDHVRLWPDRDPAAAPEAAPEHPEEAP